MTLGTTPVLALATLAGAVGGWIGRSKLTTFAVSLAGIVAVVLGVWAGLGTTPGEVLLYGGGALIMAGAIAGAIILPDENVRPLWRVLGGAAAGLATGAFFALSLGTGG